MLICCSVLLVALFVAAFFATRLMGGLGDSLKEMITGKVSYSTIEKNVKKGSLQYIETYYENQIGTGTITILTDNLIQNNILNEEDLTTTDGDVCRGYALVKRENGYLVAVPYIKCSQYETEDFREWRMGE